jgi:hypothetical protein
MNIFVGVMIFNMLVLGMNFCFLLVGGTPWHKGPEFEPVKLGKRTYTIERFTVGVSVTTLGISWFIAWFYFVLSSDKSISVLLSSHFLHISLQFATSIIMIVAGIGIFKQWSKNKGIFLTSMSLFVGSTLFSLFNYGFVGHGNITPVFMYLLTIWTLVFGGFLTMAVYLLGRMIHDWDERLSEEERVSE